MTGPRTRGAYLYSRPLVNEGKNGSHFTLKEELKINDKDKDAVWGGYVIDKVVKNNTTYYYFIPRSGALNNAGNQH